MQALSHERCNKLNSTSNYISLGDRTLNYLIPFSKEPDLSIVNERGEGRRGGEGDSSIERILPSKAP